MFFDKIWESINNWFRYMTEIVYPAQNQLDTIMWSIPYDPFSVFLWLFFIWAIIYTIFIIATWIQFILSNLNDLSNKQTLKKSILIIVFVLLWIWLTLKVNSLNVYKPFNLNLAYIMNWEVWDDEIIDSNKAYENYTRNSEYNSNEIFWENKEFKKYITFNVKDAFDPNWTWKISYLYRNEDEENYKEFLVWIYPVYVWYKDISISKWFLSNLDLYNIERTNEAVDVSFPNWKFDSTNFIQYLDLIYPNREDISKIDILPSPEELALKNNADKYITYLKDEYSYAWQYTSQEYPYKIDIILKNENDDGVKYIVLPYYNVLNFLNEEILTSESWIDALMFKDIEEINTDINQLLKFEYNSIYSKIKNNFPELLNEDIYKSTINYVTSNDRNTTSWLSISWVNEDKINFIVAYNKYYNNNLYDINIIATDTKEKIDNTLWELDVYLSQYNSYISTKNSLPENLTTAQIQWIQKIESELEKQKQKIYDKYNELLQTSIDWKVATTINVLRALEAQTLYPSYNEFIDIGWDDIENKITEQKRILRILSNHLKSQNGYFSNNEEVLIDILKDINTLQTKLPEGYEIQNNNNIVLYTIFAFAWQQETFKYSEVSDKLLLRAFCKDWKKIENTFSKLNKLWVEIDENILNCELDNWTWEIINDEKLKELLIDAIRIDIKKEVLNKEVNLISYLWGIAESNKLVNNIFTTGIKDSEESNKFLTSKIDFWKYSLISPLVYYKTLIDWELNNIPWIFINLLDIEWKVYTEKWVYNMKIWDKSSWYKDLDPVNWSKYSNPLTILWIPFLHHIPLWFIKWWTQIAYILIFWFLANMYLILLKQK